jgi:hypothetical protein
MALVQRSRGWSEIMDSHLSEDSLWASALAARLRVLQANFADDDAATRQDFIVQEIERALKGAVPEKRKALLETLAARFPCWQSSGPAPAAPPQPGEPETAVALLNRFLDLLPGLTPIELAEAMARLKRAGLLPEEPAAAFELTPDMQTRLGLTPGQRPINAARAAKALPLMLDMVLTLDQLVWVLWRQVAPKSMVRREVDVSKLTGEYLAGGADVSSAQVSQALEKTRTLIASLLGATRPAGTAFARERGRLFEPNAIEAAARPEKKFAESVEYASWRKYKQLFEAYLTEAKVEKGIEEAMVRAAETLYRGGRITG